MTGRFNQDLPENLQTAFEKATNFEPRIITKQSINNRKVHEINHIDITHGEDEVEINEAHVRNPNYKGKNYDPNYQQNRTKTTDNTTTNTASITIIPKTMDPTKTTYRRSQLMYLSHYTDQSARNSCTKSRRSYDIHHSTEMGLSQKTTQQKENMQMSLKNSTPKRWKLMKQQ